MKYLIPIVVVCVGALMYISFLAGRKSVEREIINRAQNSDDIELIIFGEKQL